MTWMFSGIVAALVAAAEVPGEPVEEAVLFDITQTGLELGLGVGLGVLPLLKRLKVLVWRGWNTFKNLCVLFLPILGLVLF